MAAKFRAAMAGHLAEPAWKTLLKRLEPESPEFCENWERHEVVAPEAAASASATRRWGGWRSTTRICGWAQPGPRMVTYAPADEETRERLEKLHEIVTGAAASGGMPAAGVRGR